MAGRKARRGSRTVSPFRASGQVSTARAYAGVTGPASAEDDTSAVSLGLEFYTTANGTVTQIHFWQPATGGSTATRTVGIYAVSTGALVQASETLTVTGSGWQTKTLTTPVPITAFTRYKAVVYHPAGSYAATGAFYSTGPGAANLVTGALIIPNNANSTLGQGTYNYATGISYPNGTFGSGNYWADVTVSTSGSASVTTFPASLLNASNTGIAKWGLVGADLPLYTGSNVPANGTVIHRKKIPFMLCLNQGNITVSECLIQPTASDSTAAVTTMDQNTFTITPSTITVRDCEIDGSLLPEVDRARTTGFMGIANVTGCYIHDVASGLAYMTVGGQLDGLLEGNYVTGLFPYGDPNTTGNHCDGLTIRDFTNSVRSNRVAIVRNNRINCFNNNATGALFLQTSSGDINNVTVEGNLLEGSGWLCGLEAISGHTYSNIVANDNRFAFQVGVAYGITEVTGGPGWATWTNNYRYDSASNNGQGAPVGRP
jgi:hypothetical protein